ncbi:hypothetical protein [Azospirillum largimobile]
MRAHRDGAFAVGVRCEGPSSAGGCTCQRGCVRSGFGFVNCGVRRFAMREVRGRTGESGVYVWGNVKPPPILPRWAGEGLLPLSHISTYPLPRPVLAQSYALC